jgi:hypothetical protein
MNRFLGWKFIVSQPIWMEDPRVVKYKLGRLSIDVKDGMVKVAMIEVTDEILTFLESIPFPKIIHLDTSMSEDQWRRVMHLPNVRTFYGYDIPAFVHEFGVPIRLSGLMPHGPTEYPEFAGIDAVPYAEVYNGVLLITGARVYEGCTQYGVHALTRLHPREYGGVPFQEVRVNLYNNFRAKQIIELCPNNWYTFIGDRNLESMKFALGDPSAWFKTSADCPPQFRDVYRVIDARRAMLLNNGDVLSTDLVRRISRFFHV